MKRNAAIGVLALIVVTFSIVYIAFDTEDPDGYSSVPELPADEPESHQDSTGGVPVADLENTDAGSSRPAAADKNVTPALPDQPPPPAPLANKASEQWGAHQIRANANLAERQALVDAVSQESLSESVQRLDSERFSPLFMDPGDGRPFFDPVSKQAQLLHQPRVARLLLAATHDGPEVRQEILNETVDQLSQYVDELKGGVAGNGRTSHWNSGIAFPLILAAVDDTGSALPLLLEWYDVEAEGAYRSAVELVERGIIESDPSDARSEAMNMIVPAVFAIVESLDSGIFRIPLRGQQGEALHMGQRLFEAKPEALGPTLALNGYELFPRLSDAQSDAVMEQLREYLAR